ncbi:uncharacterized protein LOC120183346 [Hibiscus syriacus]|uniref:uncharacterized protein LOC120183346 n=1 Tax=Hibiscus syriacus TaxID=106335 RepID=UPI001923F788|nr:uncharacterized protein LOC120183346 [Hibiscus syriacus]
MTAYLQLITSVVVVVIIRESTARELRPSDHGLEYQSQPPTGLKSQEMRSFFGSTSKSSSTSSSTPSTVAFPKATNSSDTSWWRSANDNRRGNNHLRHVLLLGSLICGVTGVALLASSAFIYVIKIRSSSPSTNNNNNNSLVTINK